MDGLHGKHLVFWDVRSSIEKQKKGVPAIMPILAGQRNYESLNRLFPRKDVMTHQHACISLCMATSLLFNAGCSLMIDQPKGEPQFPGALESKRLAGAYADHGSDGSIKPHTLVVGTAGRSDGHIILGGMLDVLDIRTGAIKRQGTAAEPTPKVRIGDTAFPAEFGSSRLNTSESDGK